MWIRTQDKETLLNVNCIDMYSLNKYEWIIEACGNDLGTYKSKERAIEVLDEIQERISPKFNYKGNNEEADLFIKTQILNSMIAVYQMPEE